VVSVTDPSGRILDFLDGAATFLSSSHYCFPSPPPENLVVPGIEPGPPNL
jgi:hypothetical protein